MLFFFSSRRCLPSSLMNCISFYCCIFYICESGHILRQGEHLCSIEKNVLNFPVREHLVQMDTLGIMHKWKEASFLNRHQLVVDPKFWLPVPLNFLVWARIFKFRTLVSWCIFSMNIKLTSTGLQKAGFLTIWELHVLVHNVVVFTDVKAWRVCLIGSQVKCFNSYHKEL